MLIFIICRFLPELISMWFFLSLYYGDYTELLSSGFSVIKLNFTVAAPPSPSLNHKEIQYWQPITLYSLMGRSHSDYLWHMRVIYYNIFMITHQLNKYHDDKRVLENFYPILSRVLTPLTVWTNLKWVKGASTWKKLSRRH